MRKEILLMIVIIIFIFALLSFFRTTKTSSEEDAKKFFLEDLEQSYPDADLREISSILKIGYDSNAYYILKGRVSKNLHSPCPERIEVEYRYPIPQSFHKIENKVVSGCNVCIDNPNCILSYEEEAIIASHIIKDANKTRDFINQYPKAKPIAEFLREYAGEKNVWEVIWSAPDADYNLQVYISQNTNKLLDIKVAYK